MAKIVLASADIKSLAAFITTLEQEYGFTILRTGLGEELLEFLNNSETRIAVVDRQLADMDGINCATQVAKRFPLVNCAVVSDLTAEDFHQKTEGLGIFCQLPPVPAGKEATRMVRLLDTIDNLLSI